MQEELLKEFDEIDAYTTNTVEPNESIKEGQKHTERNRYKTVLSYDSNRISLSKPTGKFTLPRHPFIFQLNCY